VLTPRADQSLSVSRFRGFAFAGRVDRMEDRDTCEPAPVQAQPTAGSSGVHPVKKL